MDLGKVTSYVLEDLEPYTPYELHLRVIDEDGRDGESSVVTFYTLPEYLEPPEVKVDLVTSVSAYLTWEPVKAAKTYSIFYNGSFKELEEEDVKITGLQQQQKYVFTVIAEHGRVKSEPTEVVVETIPPSYLYEYDGSLLDKVIKSDEQTWSYEYDKNGNVVKITYSPVPTPAKQEFNIHGK